MPIKNIAVENTTYLVEVELWRAMTHQMCDNSKIGSFDLVKNSFAAEPGKHTNGQMIGKLSSTNLPVCSPVCVCACACVCVWHSALTRYEAVKVWLDSFELVNIILPLFVCDLPGIVVTAGLALDLVGGGRWGHGSYRRVFLWIRTHISFAPTSNTAWCIITKVWRTETTGLPGPRRGARLEACWRAGCLQWSWPSSPGSEEASERTTFPRQEPELEKKTEKSP